MHARRGPNRGDAFDRAIREAFGETTPLAKMQEARRLYARYRTDDLLTRMKNAVSRQGDEPQLRGWRKGRRDRIAA